MAAPAVLGRASGASAAADAIQHTITLPASIGAGERLVVAFSVDGDPFCEVDTGYSGDGWEKVSQSSYSTVVTGALFTKIAAGGDALRINTDQPQQSSHVSLRIGAANATKATSANGSSTNSAPPALTLGLGSPTTQTLWVTTRSGDSTVAATAAPAGYANLQSQAAAGVNGASTNTAEKTATADSDTPGTFTSNVEQWVSFTLGVFNTSGGAVSVTQVAAELVSNAIPNAIISQVVVEVVNVAGATPPATGGMLVIAT